MWLVYKLTIVCIMVRERKSIGLARNGLQWE